MGLVRSPEHEQEDFEAVLKPIIAALPPNMSAETLANVLAAVATEFVDDKNAALWVFNFGASVALAEIDRFHAERAMQ